MMRVKDDKQTSEKRTQILQIAQEIIVREGIECLSIRKIAHLLNQTPGIIYHYFDHKEAILSAIVEHGYSEIVSTITQFSNIEDCRERLIQTLSAYMHLMCSKDILFTLLMTSKDPKIRNRINILNEDAMQRKSIQSLYKIIEVGVHKNMFQCRDIKLKTQWIWCSTYGVISTIIHEHADASLRDDIINEHVTSILMSLER